MKVRVVDSGILAGKSAEQASEVGDAHCHDADRYANAARARSSWGIFKLECAEALRQEEPGGTDVVGQPPALRLVRLKQVVDQGSIRPGAGHHNKIASQLSGFNFADRD